MYVHTHIYTQKTKNTKTSASPEGDYLYKGIISNF